MHDTWLMKLSKQLILGSNFETMIQTYIWLIPKGRYYGWKCLWPDLRSFSSPLSVAIRAGHEMNFSCEKTCSLCGFVVKGKWLYIWFYFSHICYLQTPNSRRNQAKSCHIIILQSAFIFMVDPPLIGILQMRKCRHCNVNHFPEVTPASTMTGPGFKSGSFGSTWYWFQSPPRPLKGRAFWGLAGSETNELSSMD